MEAPITFTLRLVALILPSLMLLALPVVDLGTALVCDTHQQAERFVELYDGDVQTAVSAVNAEEHDPTACGMATMAYVPGPTLATARSKNLTFQIVEILVVGFSTSEGVWAVEPAHYFSVLMVEEREAFGDATHKFTSVPVPHSAEMA